MKKVTSELVNFRRKTDVFSKCQNIFKNVTIFDFFADYESRGFILSIWVRIFGSWFRNESYPTFADPVQITQSRTISTLNRMVVFESTHLSLKASIDTLNIFLFLEKDRMLIGLLVAKLWSHK
jgi:hypothetical protein